MQVIILVGASGSGKSTWIKDQETTYPLATVTVSADHYFIQPDGTYRLDGTKLGEAHGACKREFLLALQKAVPVVFVDNTSTRRRERKEYVQEALNAGYEVWLKVFDTPAGVCAERNTHGIPLEACQKMVARVDVPAGFYQIWGGHDMPEITFVSRNTFRDGGTAEFVVMVNGVSTRFYRDYRISSTTRRKWYDRYPNKEGAEPLPAQLAAVMEEMYQKEVP